MEVKTVGSTAIPSKALVNGVEVLGCAALQKKIGQTQVMDATDRLVERIGMNVL